MACENNEVDVDVTTILSTDFISTAISAWSNCTDVYLLLKILESKVNFGFATRVQDIVTSNINFATVVVSLSDIHQSITRSIFQAANVNQDITVGITNLLSEVLQSNTGLRTSCAMLKIQSSGNQIY